ncbi:hypothetical protein [Promicromonospora sp. NPDC050880]|uniref:hypothetical protein n=1 Tax=Promicromonospora sp. NPDC050880 TaxID=3364406 RepID=UPI00378C691D
MTTTWDMETVGKVRRLGMTLHVASAELVARDREEVVEFARLRAAAQIIDAARVWAVEVHEDDVSVVESPGEFGGVVLDMQWRPFWRGAEAEVELRGGHIDGQTAMIDRGLLTTGLLVPPPMPPLSEYQDETVPYAPLPLPSRYQLSGWREVERRWVMACG